MERTEQLVAIKEYIIRKLGQDKTGRGMDHINHVVKVSKWLAINEKVDPFLLIVAAYLHDTIGEKLVDNAKVAKQELADCLRQISFSSEQIGIIMNVISSISFTHTLDKREVKLSPIGRIVRDTDWLDVIGAIGITRAIYYGGDHHEKIYNPAIKPRHNMFQEEYHNLINETIINRFDGKLLHLKNMMNAEAVEKIINHRQRVMLDFLDEFHAEWDTRM